VFSKTKQNTHLEARQKGIRELNTEILMRLEITALYFFVHKHITSSDCITKDSWQIYILQQHGRQYLLLEEGTEATSGGPSRNRSVGINTTSRIACHYT
jgi:hypothetical protein